MKKLWTIFAIIALVACGLKTGIIERLGITAIAQEMGVEFAKHNDKLVQEAIIYLDTIEKFESDQFQYVNLIQIGINYAFTQVDDARAARLKPFVDQILSEINIDPNALNLGKIELPEDFDYPAFLAAVRGFRSGLTI